MKSAAVLSLLAATVTYAGEKPAQSPLAIDVTAIDRGRILAAAAAALKHEPITIVSFETKDSPGGPNDFYSNADYWWPDHSKPGGRPYVQRDGKSNPDNFNRHRMAMHNCAMPSRRWPPPTRSPAKSTTRGKPRSCCTFSSSTRRPA